MLLQDPKERLSMAKLCDELLKITGRAESEGTVLPQPPKSVLRSLDKTDREASMRPLHEALARYRERFEALESGRKPSITTPLMKTSHRSISISSTRAGSSLRKIQTSVTAASSSAIPPSPTIPESRVSSPLAQAIDPYTIRSNTTTTNTSINNVTIREEIDAHKAQKGMKRFLTALKTKPDKELETWLKGRDIVCLHPLLLQILMGTDHPP
jgi:hypothetical protein